MAGQGRCGPEDSLITSSSGATTWRALESLVDSGLIRHLGTSNVTIPKLDLVLRDARIAPALSEMELHLCFQQPQLFHYCLDHDVQPIGYSPSGSPSRPERDRTPDDFVDLEQSVVVAIAEAHGIQPALVCLKWAVQRAQFVAALAAVSTYPLTREEMEAMKSVERNSRLIKGQVFLWTSAVSWLDLWDVDGTIVGN